VSPFLTRLPSLTIQKTFNPPVRTFGTEICVGVAASNSPLAGTVTVKADFLIV
jgi:hypothetical protein